MKTEQPKNGIRILKGELYTHVDIECDAMDGGMCAVGVATAKSEGAALRRAAKKLRELADTCDELA